MPPFWLLQPWNPQRSQQSCPELSALGFPTGFYADFFGEAAGGGVGKKSLGFIFFLHSKFLFPDAYRGENRSLKSSSVKHDSVEGEPVGLALSVCQFCFFFFFFSPLKLVQSQKSNFKVLGLDFLAGKNQHSSVFSTI